MSNVVFELFAKLGLDSSEYEKGLGNAKSLAGSVGGAIGNGLKTMAKVGVAAIGTATAAVGAFATSSVKTGADFDKSMSQVAATMGKTMDEMQNEVGSVDLAWGTFSGNLREYAQEMGKNTAFSATQAADALNYMALAGYDTQTSMEMLPNVLNLAAAGSMDLARASDMVTDTQTAFGISLERTSQMVDEMAKAASTGNTSVEQLGDAFLVVGGLAQEMNGGMVQLSDGTTATYDNVQELEIALTAMANAGIKGSEAGTHMRNMLLKLASPTEDGYKAFTALGVSVFDSEGKMRSLAGIMEDLDGAMAELTQEEKLQAISDIFNTRDTAAAEALLNAVGDDWAGIAESILDADGAAQKMADTQLDNLAGDVTLFQSALEGAKIAVSDQLTPTLREFVQFGTDGLSRLTSAFQEGGITGAMAEFGTILSEGIAMVTEMLPEAVNAGMELLGAVGQGILDNLPVIIDSAVDIVNQLVEGLVTALPYLVEGGLQILLGLAQGIAEMLPTLVPTIVDVILTIVDTLIDNIDLLIEAAIQLTMGLTEGLIAALPVLIERLPEIITSIVAALMENLPLLLEAQLQIILALAQAIVENIPLWLEALKQALDGAIATIVEKMPEFMEKGKEILTNLKDGIISLIGEIKKAAYEVLEKFIAGVREKFALVTSIGKQIIDKVKDGIKQKIEEAKTWGSDLINNFINGLKEKWENLKSTVSDIAGSIKALLGFSEPKLGPLSDFHTYAPDMMELFAKGIRDNKSMLLDTVADAFDFEKVISDATVSSNVNMGYNSNSRIITLLEEIAAGGRVEVILQEDADAMFRVMQRKSRTNKQITGQESFS